MNLIEEIKDVENRIDNLGEDNDDIYIRLADKLDDLKGQLHDNLQELVGRKIVMADHTAIYFDDNTYIALDSLEVRKFND